MLVCGMIDVDINICVSVDVSVSHTFTFLVILEIHVLCMKTGQYIRATTDSMLLFSIMDVA